MNVFSNINKIKTQQNLLPYFLCKLELKMGVKNLKVVKASRLAITITLCDTYRRSTLATLH